MFCLLLRCIDLSQGFLFLPFSISWQKIHEHGWLPTG
jgi:hypothetical protein